ncbi:hypothetical protein XENOCAPTIV_000789 [Xenoophorus captivus]|uniref:Uncharacterized protein n=1 Tax=Xenoophorus captivus TaxID=1517983 RepID=A0ABV0SFP6_9TELE
MSMNLNHAGDGKSGEESTKNLFRHQIFGCFSLRGTNNLLSSSGFSTILSRFPRLPVCFSLTGSNVVKMVTTSTGKWLSPDGDHSPQRSLAPFPPPALSVSAVIPVQHLQHVFFLSKKMLLRSKFLGMGFSSPCHLAQP